jgi:acyl-CoA synthetase (NDP forming)
MLKKEMKKILQDAQKTGWVMEPEAKRFLNLAGLPVPNYRLVNSVDSAVEAARSIGYPIVAKVVSPQVVHKSELGGVVVGIDNDEKLVDVFERFRAIDEFTGMLVEEILAGVELIIGAKIDLQFGPIVVLGTGGTAVEIYQDTSIRMAPLIPEDVLSMIKNIKAHRILEGYRGSQPVNLNKLTEILVTFSELLMQLEDVVESIDLNPVMCSSHRCIVADARIILAADKPERPV